MKTMGKKITSLTMSFLFIGFCSNVNSESTAEGKVFQLEAITVTAQKKEENKQDVPISLDAFSDSMLEDARIEDTLDLTRFSSNVHMKYNYYENLVVIRGISTIRASIYSPAGYYVDDVSYPLQFMQNTELFDVERAEILKGPQGTLYGRNTESGVVNIITRQPDNQFRSKAFGEYAKYNTFRSGASLSGPIIADRLYLGGAFQSKSSDGFVENVSTGNGKSADMRHINGRASLRWTPAGRWDISLIADVMNADDHCGGHRFITGPQATAPFKHRSDSDEYYQQDGNSQVLRMKYDGDSYNVLAVSGVLYNNLEKLNDTDLWDSPANKKHHTSEFEERQYSQELRFSSSPGGGFEWLAGLYGFIDETQIDYRYNLVSAGKIYMNPISDMDTRGYAAFGQGTYTLFDRLHLTAGLRFDHQDLDGSVEDAINNKTCKAELRYDEVLPKFSAAYDVSEDVMIYASSSRGYLAGGYNFSMTPDPKTFTYDPEYTWNYELGIKTSWLNHKLTANLSAFYIHIDDKQVMEYDWNTLAKTISNAARAHSQGIEFQLEARPSHGLDVFAGFGYNEATFDEFISTEMNAGGTALIEKNYRNNYLPYAPQYTYNVGVQYRRSNGFWGRADLLGTGKFCGDAANASQQAAYETVNLRCGYEGRHFEISLWADNIFDEEYLTFVYPYKGYVVGLDGSPLTIGTTLTWRF